MSAEMILDLQRLLRARAETLSADRPYLENELSRFTNQLDEIFLRLLAGPLQGLTAGYLSHLLLDGLTAGGIPGFARGC